MATMVITLKDMDFFGARPRGFSFTATTSVPTLISAPIRINSATLYLGYCRVYKPCQLTAVCGDTTFRTDFLALKVDDTLKKRTTTCHEIVAGTNHILKTSGQTITFTVQSNYSNDYIFDHPTRYDNGDLTLTIDYDILFQASTFTLSSSSVVMGNSVTLNIASNTLNASFTHSAKIALGGQTLTGSRTGPGALTIAIPANDTWQALLPTSTSGKATVTLTTTGNGETGTTSTTVTLSIPDDIVPTAGNLLFTGVNQYWGLQVQGVSKTTAKLSGYSGGNGTTDVTISLVGGGYSATGDTFTTGLLRTAGANEFTATVTDSRGRTATTTASIEVVEYARPVLNGITVNRCLADGTIDNESGTYVKIVADCSYVQIGENVLVADIWIDDIRKKVDEPVPLVGPYGDGQLDIAKSYAIKVSIFDGIASRANGANIYAVEMLQSSKRIINLYPSSDSGIGIGKMAELEKVVDFAEGWGLRVDGAYLSEEVYIGTNEPENQNVKIWINAEGLPWINNGGGSGGIPTGYVSEVSIGSTTPVSDDVVLWYDTGAETLKAKNNGVWVEVSTKGSGGTKEVFVGDTQPTNTSVSLWFDTDTEELKVLTGGVWVAIGGEGTSVTAESIGALPIDGTAADAEKLGGKFPVYYLTPVNVLDNGDFTNPINQRGETSYTAEGYTIDRWRLWGSDNAVTVNDGYVSVTGVMQQYLETYDPEMTYTLAACNTEGVVFCVSGVFGDEAAKADWGELAYSTNYSLANVALRTGDWVWVAVYEGEFTAEMLPPYVPKGYNAELHKCQRYAYAPPNKATMLYPGYTYSATVGYFTIKTPVPMRELPTLTVETVANVQVFYGTSTKACTNAYAYSIDNDAVSIRVTSSGMPNAGCINCRFNTPAFLDCELA